MRTLRLFAERRNSFLLAIFSRVSEQDSEGRRDAQGQRIVEMAYDFEGGYVGKA